VIEIETIEAEEDPDPDLMKEEKAENTLDPDLDLIPGKYIL
jgi:hypothetical protein